MSGRIASVLAAALAVAAGGSVAFSALPATAATSLPGSILYDKSNNVYVTDGAATRQLTTDGGTASPDSTGSSGYLVPSESNDGSVVVAARNQQLVHQSDQQKYYRGYLWVMDAYGHVIRKINPPQYAYADATSSCNGLPANNPQGIANAQVSPDGKYIAYTYTELAEVLDFGSCKAESFYGTSVIKIDGTDPVQIDDGSNDITAAQDLELGSWVSNTSFLVDRLDFGSVEAYEATLPGPSATAWFGPSSYTDAAYGQPDVRNGVLATDGYSDVSMANALRIWSSSGYTSSPTSRCEVTSAVNPGNDFLGHPSLAPDGSAVAYDDVDAQSGSSSANGQGIYTMSTANSTCGTPTLLVAHANDPFWSPAGINPPPSVVVGAHPANPSDKKTASIAFTVSYGSGVAPTVRCSLDGATPTACASPVSYSGLADGTHTVTITATAAGRTGSTSYTWQVDTAKPVVRITQPTAVAIAATKVANDWTGSDRGSGIARYYQQYRSARYDGGFGKWVTFKNSWDASVTTTTISGLSAGYTDCLRVKAVDKAGNVGFSAPRCFAVALDDRNMAASTDWKRVTGSQYYEQTATVASKAGASLSRPGASLDRVGVVVKTCPGCGTVGVYVGRELIGKVSTASSTTRERVIRMLPRFSLRNGTVIVKVLSAGKPVTVDGVVMSRS